MHDHEAKAGGHRHGHKHGHGGGEGTGYKFDPARLEKLRDPERLETQNPEAVWAVLAEGGPVRTVVDVGAGVGFFAVPFAQRLPPGGWVYGCDILPEMLLHLREAARQHQVRNLAPVLCDEAHIPLPDGLADVVFMCNLHHEFDHPQASLAEAHRLLAPGGQVAVIDWKPEETPHGPPLDVRIPPPRVRGQLEQVGFGDVREHDVMPWHYYLTARR